MTQTTSFSAPAIQCEGCAASIKRALLKLTGVENVRVDISGKSVTVQYDSAQVGKIALQERLATLGFPAEESETTALPVSA